MTRMFKVATFFTAASGLEITLAQTNHNPQIATHPPVPGHRPDFTFKTKGHVATTLARETPSTATAPPKSTSALDKNSLKDKYSTLFKTAA
ncbi:hypothetical protein DSO57_1039223 [Entomophthora muscae]|uniref:Uncharacterized protein n=1 Tax=Entomophthora muscae TaxID=34485 RepID=A0ACC2SYG5_9FUNG|nr:hypothetical protein DSO57_1039223 [Entomophthora muscae]